MISSFAIGLLPIIVQAQTPLITLWGIRILDPYWYYHYPIWDAIKTELLNVLNIDIKIDTMDAFTFDAIFYDDWEIPGDTDGNPATREGWDLTIREWRLNPTSYIWLDEIVLSDHVPEWNVMPWLNEKADSLYHSAMATLDPATHKQLMWWWQEEFMHDPSVIPMYYSELMTGRASYLDGWDDTAWFYDLRSLRINLTKFAEVAPASRKAVGNDTAIYGASEFSIYAWHPFYTLTYTEELMNVVRMDMLYGNTRQNMEYPTSGSFEVYPCLAADFPTWYDSEELGYEPGYAVARIPLRQDVYWSDGVPFNATDVAFTINAVLDKKAGSIALADYIHIIKEAVVVDELTVDIMTYNLRYDLAGYFAHGWAFAMLPWHQFKAWGIADKPTAWKAHASNFDWKPESMGGEGLEVLGPYVPVASDYPVTTFIEFQRFDLASNQSWYWPALGWGTQLPKNFIVKIIPNEAERLIDLQTLEVDFFEPIPAPIEMWLDMVDWPTHRVYSFPYPASNILWMNLNNPILSNRYVRQAIAHVIPSSTIFHNILPGWGVATAILGKTFILPWHESFHTELPPYEYDPVKAQMYMAMYWNSLDNTTRPGNDDPAVYNLGPAGDHDLNGFVELADFSVWTTRFGTSPSVYQQYDYPYPIDPTDPNRYLPGNDVDADNDNNDLVELADFLLWTSNFGTEYPFPGAR